MDIMTVSRQSGSLGEEIAGLLSSKLGFRLQNRSVMEQAVNGGDFPEIQLERYEEHSPSFRDNFTTGKDVYLDRLKTAILESAVSGKVVFLGRGSQFVLGGTAFHVRIIASHDVRVKRVMSLLNCNHKTADRYCRKSDHDRSGFNRFFFGGQWSDPSVYSITLCTDHLDAESAANIIAEAFRAAPSVQNLSELKNRLTAQKVRNRILYTEHIPVSLLDVEASGSRVTIRGTVPAKDHSERCKMAALAVSGVSDAETEIYYINPVIMY